MAWVLYFISVLWIALGCLLILYTEQTTAQGKEIVERFGRVPSAITAAVAGVLLIAAAFSGRNTTVVVIIGLLALGKGVVLFVNPGEIYEKSLAWWFEQASEQTYRFTGIVLLILGTAILSWA